MWVNPSTPGCPRGPSLSSRLRRSSSLRRFAWQQRLSGLGLRLANARADAPLRISHKLNQMKQFRRVTLLLDGLQGMGDVQIRAVQQLVGGLPL